MASQPGTSRQRLARRPTERRGKTKSRLDLGNIDAMAGRRSTPAQRMPSMSAAAGSGSAHSACMPPILMNWLDLRRLAYAAGQWLRLRHHATASTVARWAPGRGTCQRYYGEGCDLQRAANIKQLPRAFENAMTSGYRHGGLI